MMMMMMMKLPILLCAEKRLVLSTAPKHEITPTKTVKDTFFYYNICIKMEFHIHSQF